jgi:hypothetical protein
VIAELASTVHTAGINWASVLTIVCSVVGALGIIFGFIARAVTKSLSRAITDAIRDFQISVVNLLATRLSIVETKVDLLVNTRGRDKSND